VSLDAAKYRSLPASLLRIGERKERSEMTRNEKRGHVNRGRSRNTRVTRNGRARFHRGPLPRVTHACRISLRRITSPLTLPAPTVSRVATGGRKNPRFSRVGGRILIARARDARARNRSRRRRPLAFVPRFSAFYYGDRHGCRRRVSPHCVSYAHVSPTRG